MTPVSKHAICHDIKATQCLTKTDALAASRIHAFYLHAERCSLYAWGSTLSISYLLSAIIHFLLHDCVRIHLIQTSST